MCARIASRRLRSTCGVPVGVSIGKSRAVPLDPIEHAIADYASSFREARRVANFVVVNVSSPNTKDLRAMQGAEIARRLLTELTYINEGASAESVAMGTSPAPRVPLLVKIAPDLTDAEIEALLAVVEETKLDGVIATNTTIARAGLRTPAARIEAIGAGGLSGPPLRARALDVVARVRTRLGERVTVIGVGGVESADDVIALVRAGADLVQMYTGFVYGGPLVARRIARDLSRRLDAARATSLKALTYPRDPAARLALSRSWVAPHRRANRGFVSSEDRVDLDEAMRVVGDLPMMRRPVRAGRRASLRGASLRCAWRRRRSASPRSRGGTGRGREARRPR